MRYLYFLASAALSFGCASSSARPIAAAAPAPARLSPNIGVEVRHMYLVEPGKKPVLIVDRQNEPSTAQEISAEPPSLR